MKALHFLSVYPSECIACDTATAVRKTFPTRSNTPLHLGDTPDHNLVWVRPKLCVRCYALQSWVHFDIVTVPHTDIWPLWHTVAGQSEFVMMCFWFSTFIKKVLKTSSWCVLELVDNGVQKGLFVRSSLDMDLVASVPDCGCAGFGYNVAVKHFDNFGEKGAVFGMLEPATLHEVIPTEDGDGLE